MVKTEGYFRIVSSNHQEVISFVIQSLHYPVQFLGLFFVKIDIYQVVFHIDQSSKNKKMSCLAILELII